MPSAPYSAAYVNPYAQVLPYPNNQTNNQIYTNSYPNNANQATQNSSIYPSLNTFVQSNQTQAGTTVNNKF